MFQPEHLRVFPLSSTIHITSYWSRHSFLFRGDDLYASVDQALDQPRGVLVLAFSKLTPKALRIAAELRQRRILQRNFNLPYGLPRPRCATINHQQPTAR